MTAMRLESDQAHAIEEQRPTVREVERLLPVARDHRDVDVGSKEIRRIGSGVVVEERRNPVGVLTVLVLYPGVVGSQPSPFFDQAGNELVDGLRMRRERAGSNREECCHRAEGRPHSLDPALSLLSG